LSLHNNDATNLRETEVAYRDNISYRRRIILLAVDMHPIHKPVRAGERAQDRVILIVRLGFDFHVGSTFMI
jgi:hypothetical protein